MRSIDLNAQEIRIIRLALIAHLSRLNSYLNNPSINYQEVEADIKTLQTLLDSVI